MRIQETELRELLHKKVIELDQVPSQKGAYLIYFKGKAFFVWRDEHMIYISMGHFWNKTYKIKIEKC